MINAEKRIDAGGVLFWLLAGFMLATAIIQGAADEGAHIMRGHAERLAILTAATRAGVKLPPEVLR